MSTLYFHEPSCKGSSRIAIIFTSPELPSCSQAYTEYAEGEGPMDSVCFLNVDYNNNITSMALKSSGARARKRNKTKSLIKFKSWGHIGVIISMRGRRLFKVHCIFIRSHNIFKVRF